MMKNVLSAVCIAALCPISASAKDNDKDDNGPRELIECVEAKDIVKIARKLTDIKPERRDTVASLMSAKFEIKDGGGFPDRLFFRQAGTETPFTISPDGKIPDFGRIGEYSEDGELCAEDKTRVGKLKSEDDINFEVDMDVMFKNRSGAHSMDELEDGVGDGKSHYKKLVPGPLSLMVPKMTHVTVTYDDETTPAQITALRGGAPLGGLVIEPFDGSHVIELDHLKDLGAESLVIAGGPYKLEPTPSIKKMKNFGGKDDESGDDKDE